MTMKVNNNDQRLIALFSAEIWGEFFSYSPDQACLARVSRAFREHIEVMRGRFLDFVSVEPNIHYALKLINPAYSNSRKIQVLSQFIDPPVVYECPLLFVQRCGKGIDEIFTFACKHKIDRAKKLLALSVVSERGVDSALTNALLAKNIDLVKLLLPRASHSLINHDYLFLERICAFQEAFELLIKSDRKFKVGIALKLLDAKGTAFLLQSKRPLNQNYYPMPDISDSQKAGLHSALIFAASEDNIAKVKAILTYAKPSKEILQHVRNRIQFYKDHGHLGRPRLAQLTRSLIDAELDNAMYRDQILTLLDVAIAQHPQIEPAIVSDPAFEIPSRQLVQQEQAVVPQEEPPEEEVPVPHPILPPPNRPAEPSRWTSGLILMVVLVGVFMNSRGLYLDLFPSNE